MVTINVDFMDHHIRDLWLDVILLAIDLTSFETQNGCQQFPAFRQIAGTQQWLEGIFETFPNIPVILVGTKAELIRPSSFAVSLQMLEDLMNRGRSKHSQLYSSQLCSTCFLCSSRTIFSRCLNVKSSSKFSCIDFSLTSTYGVVTSPCFMADSTDSTAFNGNLSPSVAKQCLNNDCEHSSANFPHVIGYYEIDSRKCFPKDNKKHNASVELLRKAILRHFAGDNCLYSLDTKMNALPDAWMTFIKHLHLATPSSTFPLVPYDQIVAICRSFDVVYWQIPLLLRYCQNRGRMVLIDNFLKTSIELVVMNPNWLVQIGYKLLQRVENVISEVHNIKGLVSNVVSLSGDKSFFKGMNNILSGLCTFNFLLEIPERAYYVPKIAKRGDPDSSIWPSVPEFEEKQITCEVELRRQKSYLFKDLVYHILSVRAKEMLKVQQSPIPLVLSHHVVFFAALDIECCEDCMDVNSSKKLACILQSNNLNSYFTGSRTSSNIFHKIRISYNDRQNSLRVFVRGSMPCCIMKSVLHFVYLHLDDSEDDLLQKTSKRNAFMTSRNYVKSRTFFLNFQNLQPSLCICCKMPRCQKRCLTDNLDDRENRHYILCPKCVLSKRLDPQPIYARGMCLKRKPLCDYWHHFGSWQRAATGNYKFNPTEIFCWRGFMQNFVPDNEIPRLAMLLLSTSNVCKRDWMSQCKARFMEGFEVHFLCENLTGWHIVENSSFRMICTRKTQKSSDASLNSLLSLALIFIQVIQGCNEFPCNAKLLIYVAQTFAEMPEYQRLFESEDVVTINSQSRSHDYYCWLLRNKERIVSNLTKILSTVGDGIPDLFFKNTVPVCAEKLFQVPTTGSRTQLAKFLQIDLTSGAFGDLKPIYLGRELRWVCQEHYEQLLSI